MSEKTPLTDMVARLTGAWKVLSGNSPAVWFGPNDPPAPIVTPEQEEGVRGRQFDFPVGQNIRMTPRQGEATTFAQMRALADNCDILRLVIETRKDQMAKMKFAIRPADPKQKVDARCKEVEAFLRMPDGENPWSEWLRMLLEDMFVVDAATVYPWLNNDGTPYRFELLDGTTIKRVIDARGRTPAPPYPAYQQVLKGFPAVNYTADELLYSPRNKRTHKMYGYGPVEQIIMTVNIAIRRALYQLQYYTEGSKPDLLFQVPPDWNMTQIKDFTDWWDSILSGNTAQRRKAQFVPNGVTPINTKEGVLKDDYDEWLARIICYAFSVSPQAFVKEMNRATAESAQQQALAEGLHPVLLWVKGVVDTLVWKYFGYHDLEFAWEDQESVAPETQSKIDDTSVKNGTTTINEIRAKRGDDPVEGGDVAMVLTANGYVPITSYFENKAAEAERMALESKRLEAEAANPKPAAPEAGANGETDSAPTQPPAKAEKQPQTAEKGAYLGDIRKAAKAIKPINRERGVILVKRAAMTRDIAAFFKSQIEAIASQVGGLTKADGKKDPADEIVFTTWEEGVTGAAEKYLIDTAKSGVGEAYTQIALSDPAAFEVANLDAIDWAKDRAAEMVGMKVVDGELVVNPNSEYSIQESTREMIRSDVTQAVDEGWSTNDLANKLQDNYAFSDERAEAIARTEIAKADVEGSKILYRESGVVSRKRWITGAECCDECQALDGEEADLDDTFKGGEGDPPLHPLCRCDIIPLLGDEE